MKFKYLWVLLLLPAMAAQAEKLGENPGWSGESELGYVRKTGNTESQSLHAKQKLVFNAKPWVNILTLSATNTSSDGVRSGEKYYVTEQLDYFMSERNYAFGRGTWEKDRFSGYEYQGTWVIGFGRDLIVSDALSMKGEVGAGQSIDKIEEDLTVTPPVLETTEREAMLYLSEELVWSINNHAEFGQQLNIEHTDLNTISRFDIYLQSALVGNIAMKVAYGMKYSTDVPEGVEHKDEEMTVTLTYRF